MTDAISHASIVATVITTVAVRATPAIGLGTACIRRGLGSNELDLLDLVIAVARRRRDLDFLALLATDQRSP